MDSKIDFTFSVNNNYLEKLLAELLSLSSETEFVEFKSNYYSPELIGEYISALSNSACLSTENHGYLIFGIENKTHNVTGTSFKASKCKVGNEELENWLATQLNPRVDFYIYEFHFQDKSVVVFKIEAAFFMPVKFKGKAYIRIGSYKKTLADHPEKERKIWLKCGQIKFEEEIALSNVRKDEALDLLDYKNYFYLLDLNLPDDKIAILDKLEEEGFIVKNEGNYDIKNLGAILFSRKLSDFPKLTRKAIRVIIYEGKNRLKTKKEKEGIMGYAISFEALLNYINNQLPMNEEIGRVFRRETKMYPEISIRELVANAIIHQDFRERGTGPMVEIFSDRIEISNPGKPLINTLRFIDHPPISRNETLASFMRRINICEERGSGIDKVISSIEVYQLPAPDFVGGSNFLRVTLYESKSLRKMDKRDKIRSCYQHCCLKYVSNELMTNKSLRERLKIEKQNYPMVSRIISDTLNTQLIKYRDPSSKSRRHTKYIPFWA